MRQASLTSAPEMALVEPAAVSKSSEHMVLIIDPRPLLRQLLQGFIESSAQMRVVSAPSIRDWLRSVETERPDVILLSIPDSVRLPGSLSELLLPAKDQLASVPIVVQSNERPAHQILELLKIGIKGFIPTSVSTGIAVQALQLVCAGGTYVPTSCLSSLSIGANHASEGPDCLTSRQRQVVEAIRQGKPNKIIAYELNMCESTVKVHVRAIMKKMKAKNRTEVAYLYASSLGEAEGPQVD